MAVKKAPARIPFLAFVSGCASFLLAGCGPGGGAGPSGAGEPPVVQSTGRAMAGSEKQRQLDLLNRIRSTDPQFRIVQKAVLNENNELGIVFSRSVCMDSLPALMRTFLTQLNQEFPGQDLSVMAYAPTQPPVRMGTARLDSRTRTMTYTPENH
jgi:hypothetical protein